ncbi:MAG TPA: LysE family transporter [Saprospiraceae bacterium]|nr:LysE family transporter [Saprospiraceae bacterium]
MRFVNGFSAGVVISFIGSLPLGTVNVAALQLSMTEGYLTAWWFALGGLLAEIIYIQMSFLIKDRIMRYQLVRKSLQWISFVFIFFLAIFSFISAIRNNHEEGNMLLANTVPVFFYGFILMAINPLQIPFWTGWGALLQEKQIMQSKARDYNLFTLGAAIGSIAGSILFISGGRMISTHFEGELNIINWVIGAVFLLAATLQLYKIFSFKKTHTGFRS